MVEGFECLNDFSQSVNGEFLTKKGDISKKGEKKVISSIVMIQRVSRGWFVRLTTSLYALKEEQREEKRLRAVLKIQRFISGRSDKVPGYARRVNRGNLYGDKLWCEEQLRLLRKSDNFDNTKVAYYYKRLNVIDEVINAQAVSPEVSLLNEEMDQIQGCLNHHRKHIQQMELEIKHQRAVMETYQKRHSTLLDKKVKVVSQQHEIKRQKAMVKWRTTDFYEYCEQVVGLSKAQYITTNADGEEINNEAIFLMYSKAKPFKEEKLSKLKVRTSHAKVIKSAPKKKKASAPACPPCSSEQCGARKLARDEAGQWGLWERCGQRCVDGESVCKRHLKANPDGMWGDGSVPEKYKHLLDKPSKWWSYITETCDNKDANRKEIGLEDSSEW